VGAKNVVANPGQGHILTKSSPENDIGIIDLDKGKDTPLQNIQ
jgi:hypothetical protein